MKENIEKIEILTREEVMDFLKIGRSTFYKLVREGRIKCFREGKRYKVPAQSLEEYIEGKLR